MSETERLLSLLAANAPAGTEPVHITASGDAAFARAIEMARAHTRRQKIVELVDVAALDSVAAGEIAAIVAEPALRRASGVTEVPPGELRTVRSFCTEHNVLLVDDERFVGGGRTGFLWAITRDGVSPDLAVAGETIAGGGTSIGVVFASPAIGGATEPAFEAETSSVEAAATYLATILEGTYLGEVRRKAANLTDMLTTLRAHPNVRSIRQRGLIAGIEVEDAACVARAAGAHGIPTRTFGDVVVVEPPLSIEDAELLALVESVRSCL